MMSKIIMVEVIFYPSMPNRCRINTVFSSYTSERVCPLVDSGRRESLSLNLAPRREFIRRPSVGHLANTNGVSSGEGRA